MAGKPGKIPKCRTCYKKLSDENVRIGFCNECAVKEIGKLKKRIATSLIFSCILIGCVLLIRGYVCRNSYAGAHDIMIIPTFFGDFMFNASSFHRVFYPSVTSGALFLAVCFFIPFTSYVQIEYNTYRHRAEQELYQVDIFAGRMVAGANNQRMDDAGIFIASLIVSALSGPYFFVYRIFKLWQLSGYVERLERS